MLIHPTAHPLTSFPASINNRAALLLGHTRWRTRGDERVNSNNHPIRAGEVIGTHNGTIYNADYLFRRWKLRRFAEVDSEILFRLAANAARDGAMDIERFKARLRRCRGQITAVIACRTDPGTVFVLVDKGLIIEKASSPTDPTKIYILAEKLSG